MRPASRRALLLAALLSATSGALAREVAPPLDADAAAALSAVAEGRAVVVMRHALAPGTSDPAGFDVDDCATQRNLSDAGREQARRIGERLAAGLGTRAADVHSSAWCRCLETARLLGLGEVRRLPALDSFFGDRARGPEATATLEAWIDARLASGAEGGTKPPAVLVTHQVNVTALTGVYPASGEVVVFGLRAGAARPAVLARLPAED